MTTFFDYFFGAGLAIVALVVAMLVLLIIYEVIAELVRSKDWQLYLIVWFVFWIIASVVYFTVIR